MRSKRTDLAEELLELAGGRCPGVRTEKIGAPPLTGTLLSVETEEASRALGKPCGRYITLSLAEIWERREECFSLCAGAVADALSRLLPEGLSEVLVVGLGNRRITPDCIGPAALDSVMVTRHLREAMPECFGHLRSVAAVTPGVLGITGVETAEIVRGVCEHCAPSAVIAVDALASRRTERVLRSVQLTDTGISPGSGLGERRVSLNAESLGVPVIALGVPTMVDAATLAADVLEESGRATAEAGDVATRYATMFLTPREIDAEAASLAKILGYGINLALHPGMDCGGVTAFLA